MLLMAAIAAVAVAGCLGPRETSGSTPSHGGSPSQPSTPRYYTTNFTCTTQGVTANGQMRMQPDSIVWASVSKILELGRARLTPDSVVVYVKITGSCFRGTYADLYRRFHYRTSFAEVTKMLMSDNAEKQIADIIKAFDLDAEVTMEPWKRADRLTFPFSVPSNVKPL